MTYSLSAAAAATGVSRKTLRKAIADGRLHARRDNDKLWAPYHIAPEDLERAFPASERARKITPRRSTRTKGAAGDRMIKPGIPARKDLAALLEELNNKVMSQKEMAVFLSQALRALEKAGALDDLREITDAIYCQVNNPQSLGHPPDNAAVVCSIAKQEPDAQFPSQPMAARARIAIANKRLGEVTAYVRKLTNEGPARRSGSLEPEIDRSQ